MKYPARIICAGAAFKIMVEKRDFDTLPPKIEEKVDRVWEEIKQYDPGIPDTPLFLAHGADAVRVEDDTIHLVCGPSSRKYLRGTTHENVATISGGRYIRRGVSMLSVTTTADNCLFMGVRKPVITYPLQRHHVAGRLEVKENDPVTGVYAEYRQEAGLERNEVHNLTCIGVAADMVYQSMSFEFIFRATTSLTARQLMERALRAKSADEHIMFEVFPWDPKFIRENVLLPEPDGFPPTGFAGLVMALRHDFGSDVFPDWEPESTTYPMFMGRRGQMLGIK